MDLVVNHVLMSTHGLNRLKQIKINIMIIWRRKNLSSNNWKSVFSDDAWSYNQATKNTIYIYSLKINQIKLKSKVRKKYMK